MIRPAALLLVLLPFAAVPAAAQTEVLPRGTFGETIEVRVIDVEVVVTDARGRRVTGLERDDFRLYAGGVEVPIAFFDEVWDGEVVRAAVETGQSGTGVAETDGAAAPAPPETQAAEALSTSFLLFVDDYFTRPADRNRVLAELEDDLAALGPGDRFAAVTWDGRELEVLTDWTSDRGEMERAVAAAREGEGYRAFIERQSARGNPQRAARLLAEQLQRTYGAVATALRAFSEVDGRRVAVLVAGGWPFEIPSDQLDLVRSRLFDTRTPALRVADLANATGFTLYPVDAEGNRGGPGVSAEQSLSDVTGGERFADDLAEFGREESLLRMARRTGGEALIDGRRLGALEAVVADTRSFYWLGFEYARAGDGGVREIRVEVDRPGLTARFRRTFIDPSPQVEAELAAERALLLGSGDGPRLEVQLGEAQRDGRRWQVPFEVTVPLNSVTVQMGEDGMRTELELRVAVEDGQGERADIAEIPLDLPLDPRMIMQGDVAYAAAVRLRDRRHVLVFTLTDKATGVTIVGRQEFNP